MRRDYLGRRIPAFASGLQDEIRLANLIPFDRLIEILGESFEVSQHGLLLGEVDGLRVEAAQIARSQDPLLADARSSTAITLGATPRAQVLEPLRLPAIQAEIRVVADIVSSSIAESGYFAVEGCWWARWNLERGLLLNSHPDLWDTDVSYELRARLRDLGLGYSTDSDDFGGRQNRVTVEHVDTGEFGLPFLFGTTGLIETMQCLQSISSKLGVVNGLYRLSHVEWQVSGEELNLFALSVAEYLGANPIDESWIPALRHLLAWLSRSGTNIGSRALGPLIPAIDDP